MCALHTYTHTFTHIHSYTDDGGIHPTHQDQLGVQCVAQGHFNTSSVGTPGWYWGPGRFPISGCSAPCLQVYCLLLFLPPPTSSLCASSVARQVNNISALLFIICAGVHMHWFLTFSQTPGLRVERKNTTTCAVSSGKVHSAVPLKAIVHVM